ncbi:MAG: 3-phosphoglycerate dehydrogenase, partial [Clostridia bacterium]|nr:3-phosphoglycerate dehydrogenase [Clostridia bacterium]
MMDANIENPDAIIVRSADMHAYVLEKTVQAVARAGVGVNNIPLDAYAEKGVVVFNSPGAN